MKLGKFIVDCTPPTGTPVGFGIGKKTDGVRDKLWLRGVILDDGSNKCVIASMDYCGLMNSAYDHLVGAIAEAVGTSVDHVTIHCIHQHDAPLICFEIEDILDITTFPREWWNNLLSQAAIAAKKSLSEMICVSSVGYAETRIHGYASNRRIIGEDGKVAGMRYSKCDEVELKEKPVGTIDPFLRTIAFKDSNNQVVVSWNFYATHPQVANGRNMFSADAPGEAVRITENSLPESSPCFFTGLSGNVTAGKYTSPTDLEGNLKKFGKILADGISHNLNSMRWDECKDFKLESASFEFPRKERSGYSSEEGIDNAEIFDAVLQSCHDYDKNKIYCLRMLSIGSVKIMLFPGEPFVEYQLFAQSLIPDEFIAIAGNCSDNFLYLPLEKSFAEGGYETEGFCWCDERIEKELKKAIKALI